MLSLERKLSKHNISSNISLVLVLTRDSMEVLDPNVLDHVGSQHHPNSPMPLKLETSTKTPETENAKAQNSHDGKHKDFIRDNRNGEPAVFLTQHSQNSSNHFTEPNSPMQRWALEKAQDQPWHGLDAAARLKPLDYKLDVFKQGSRNAENGITCVQIGSSATEN